MSFAVFRNKVPAHIYAGDIHHQQRPDLGPKQTFYRPYEQVLKLVHPDKWESTGSETDLLSALDQSA